MSLPLRSTQSVVEGALSSHSAATFKLSPTNTTEAKVMMTPASKMLKKYAYPALLWLCWINVLFLLFASPVEAALELKQPPAMLSWLKAERPVYSNVHVLRYDRVGFYYYDPSSTDHYAVWESKSASQNDPNTPPTWLNGEVTPPYNLETGEPLPLDQSLPLTPAYDREFGLVEPLFIVATGPIVPDTAYGMRPDGRQFMVLDVDAGAGYRYSVALTETAPGSRVYVGYLQPNITDTAPVVPPGSELTILYDHYGDVPDSQTIYAPWNVSLPDWDRVASHRRGSTHATPLVDNPLYLRKQAYQSNVSIGDFVKYQISLENVGAIGMPDVKIVDLLPSGFRYQAGSAYLDGVAVDPFISPTARELSFDVGTVAPAQVVTVSYVVEVTALAKAGRAINRAIARSGGLNSIPATAEVKVEEPFNRDRAFLMGRVIAGECGEDDAMGVEGVRIYMEDGTSVVTDSKGRWNLPGVTAGLHVLQLDSITLDPAYRIRSCFENTRKAGSKISRFVDIQGGMLWRENWYVEQIPGKTLKPTARELAAESEKKANQPGFVNLRDGISFPHPVFSAIAQMDSRLTPKLLLNGEPIADSRIGMRMPDLESGLTRYTWIGLELSQIGNHTLELQGEDPFGNVRFREEIEVRRSGRIKTIRVAKLLQNSADGRTPISVQLQLIDEFDKPLTSGADLSILSGELRPHHAAQSANPLASRGGSVVRVDHQGIARFEPVGTAGNYRITLAADDQVSAEITIPVAPDLREWILVGFAEGTVGYNQLKGNMSELQDEEKHGYVKGKSAFFARGQIKGEWLLTLSYDSRRGQKDTELMQRIDPQKWYVLYGDESFRSHDAPSTKKLYLRIERADFYALYGDYDTGLNITELSRYQRTLTGVKAEYSARNVSAVGFAAKTDQGFVRDDIAADGTSGLYRLSRGSILPGSDEVEIEVRDRFTNEVLSTIPLVRYIDYNLDYQDGSLYFRFPIMTQDENFNPQRIVVRYEVTAGAEKWVGGGRVALHDAERKLEVGLTRVDDRQVEGNLTGVDATWKPNDAHTLKAEAALTRNQIVGSSNVDAKAWMVEHTYVSERFDSRVKLEENEGQFGLGQLADDDDDLRTALVSTRYRFTENFALAGDATHQKILSDDSQRDTAEARVEYSRDDWTGYAGARHTRDHLSGSTETTRQWVFGARRSLLDQRLILSMRGENSARSNDNLDYPNLLALGADYYLNSKVMLFAHQEFAWGAERQSQESRLGVQTSPWRGGTLSTEMRHAHDEYGPRLMAHSGVFQTIQLNESWSADFGVDRAQSINNGTAAPNLDSFDDRRPLAFGTRNEDYTAVHAGIGYQTADWQWTNRAEYRRSETDDKRTFMSGFHHRLDEIDTLTGRILHFSQEGDFGYKNSSTQLDFSFSRRPLSDRFIWLNRTQLIFDTQIDSLGEQKGRRLVNNSLLNFVFRPRHQLSLQYGARYVMENIDEKHYSGYSDLIGGEYRYDLHPRWDLGFRTSLLNSYSSDVHQHAYGVMAGYSPAKDLWISLGYNFKGFYDNDFDQAESRVQGVVLNFRIKFDQDRFRR